MTADPRASRQEKMVLAVRVVLGLLFVYAASLKFVDLHAFSESIDGYRLTPPSWSPTLALFVPSLELVVGVSLVIGRGARGAALLCAIMLVGFSAAIGQAMIRGINIDCGCFGASGPQKADTLALVRNGALLLLALVALIKPASPSDRPRTSG